MSKYHVTVYQDQRTGYWCVEVDIDGTNTGVSYFATRAEAIAYADRKRHG